jgi:translation initiation factor IF-3
MAKKQKQKVQTKTYNYKINENITSSEVRVIGENVKVGIYDIHTALNMAFQVGLDLIEINKNAFPPVCKIEDYSKFIYKLKKKEKLNKKNSINLKVKELKFGPNTDDHDYNFKLEHAKKFLIQGHRLKLLVRFKGRQIVHKDRGEILLLKLLDALKDNGKVEQLPKLEGNRMIALVSPKKLKK